MLSARRLVLFVFAAVSVLASQSSGSETESMIESACATLDSDTIYRKLGRPSLEFRSLRKRLPDAGSTVKVYWNVLGDFEAASHPGNLNFGNVPDSTIHRQLQVLNQDFGPAGLSFKLQKINRVENATWFDLPYFEDSDLSVELEMKSTLGVKDPAVLNIYSIGSYMPRSWSLVPTLQGLPFPGLDGVVLNVRALVSDTYPGHSLTHEVGHWSGLQHTFLGGCDPVNDGVDDTPPHTDVNKQCAKPVYSCPGGLPDPTDNFMAYLEDKCRKRFTPGQIERMREILKAARGITLGAPRRQ